MKRFAFFLKNILPAIIAANSLDDGSIVIIYNGVDNKPHQTIMPLHAYEHATSLKTSLDGLMDHMNDLN